MASPFAAFRKYQALLLAVFGVMIIVVFTVGDSVSRMAGDAAGTEDGVVVKWDGVELKQSRLNALQTGRQVVLYGLSKVQDDALRKGAFPQFQQQMQFAQRFNPGASLPRPRMIFSEGDMTPEGTVRTMVLAQRARDLGIKIPDSQIIQYLTDLTDGKLNYSEIYAILVGGENSRYKQSIKTVFSVLREEMLANKVFEEFFRGTVAMPAAQQLDYYARMNRQIEAEVVSIPVEPFIDQVADPSDKELRAYFDKYKSQTPPFENIGGVAYQSPEPGFKLPHRVSVEYVKVNSEELLDDVRDKVTEEEIVAYYEENKARDENMHAPDDLLLPSEEDPNGDGANPDGGGDDDSKGDDKSTGENDPAPGDGDPSGSGGEADASTPQEGSDASGDGAESGKNEPDSAEPAEEDTATTEKNQTETTDAGATDAGETDAGETGAGAKGAGRPAAESGSSIDRLSDRTYFALLQRDDSTADVDVDSAADKATDVATPQADVKTEDAPGAGSSDDPATDGDSSATDTESGDSDTDPADTDPADAEPSDAEPADAEPADAEPADDAEPGDAEPADDTEPGDAEPGDAGEKPPSGTETGETDPKEAANGVDAETGKEIPKAINYKPLDEVREYIRQKIAQEKATASIDEKFGSMRKRMDSYYKMKSYTDDDDAPAIKQLDFKKLAEKNGLEPHAIELKSAWYYQRETDIGKSFRQEPPTRFNPYGSQLPFLQLIFRQGEQSEFVPKETRDDEGYRYLAWKVDEREAEVPELAGSVRDDVLRAWKTGAGLDDDSDKARGLARERAEELARQVRDGTSMVNVAVEQKGGRAIKTEPFSWLTQGNAAPANLFAPPPLRLSEIEDIDQPGVEFMRTAFGLDLDGVGVAMNHPRSHAFVIRPTFQNKGEAVIQKEFLSKMDDRFVAQQIASAAQLDWRLLSQDWFDEIDSDMNVVWLKPEVRNSR